MPQRLLQEHAEGIKAQKNSEYTVDKYPECDIITNGKAEAARFSPAGRIQPGAVNTGKDLS